MSHWTSHKEAAQIENIRWLLDDVGLHIEQVAKRVGLSPGTIEKKLGRRQGGKSDTPTVTDAGRG